MERKELTIDLLKAKGGCFLVEFSNNNEKIFKYLKEEKYSQIPYKSSLPRGTWIYVNIVTKIYRYGTIGIGIVPEVIGNHAVSVYDFIRNL